MVWTNNSIDYNLAAANFITHFEPCFVARKGGYKVKLIPRVNSTSGDAGLTHSVNSIKKYDPSSTFSLTDQASSWSTVSQSQYTSDYYYIDYNTGFYDGVQAQMVRTFMSNVLDPNLPYYGDRKFLCSRTINNPSSAYPSGLYGWGNATQANVRYRSSATTNACKFSKFVSTREDYSLFFFLSTPVCYFTDNVAPV